MLDLDIYNLLAKYIGNTSLKGFNYIVCGIEIIDNLDNPYQLNIMDLYKKIANNFNTTSTKVERAIRHYKHKLFIELDLTKLFNTKIYSKYTNAELIFNCYNLYINKK
jgi:hypothetical protein